MSGDGLTLADAVQILRDHNAWRRDNNYPSVAPKHSAKLIGQAIDLVCDVVPELLDDLQSELISMIANRDAGPPTDEGLCIDCGQWTPWNHPESDQHSDNCAAAPEFAKRRNWQKRANTLIEKIAAYKAARTSPNATGATN